MNHHYPLQYGSNVELLLLFTYSRFTSLCVRATPKNPGRIKRESKSTGITLADYEQALSQEVMESVITDGKQYV